MTTSGDVGIGNCFVIDVFVWSINASSIGVSGDTHCVVVHGVVVGETDTPATVNIPGVYDDCAHGVVVVVCGHTTVDGGIYHGTEVLFGLFPLDHHCHAVGNW